MVVRNKHSVFNKQGIVKFIEVICKRCGNTFTTSKSNPRKFCSDTCKMWEQRERTKKSKCYINNRIKRKAIRNNKKNIEEKCVRCNKLFYSHIPNSKFCSKECNSKFYKEKYYSDFNNGTISNNYLKLRFEIFKRDNFTCQYCGRNVKEDKIKLNIEHIIPRSLGGSDAPENLTTACVECNLGKRDTLLENKQIYSKNDQK